MSSQTTNGLYLLYRLGLYEVSGSTAVTAVRDGWDEMSRGLMTYRVRSLPASRDRKCLFVSSLNSWIMFKFIWWEIVIRYVHEMVDPWWSPKTVSLIGSFTVRWWKNMFYDCIKNLPWHVTSPEAHACCVYVPTETINCLASHYFRFRRPNFIFHCFTDFLSIGLRTYRICIVESWHCRRGETV